MDAMLLGQDKTGKRNAVVMEFKQWESCEAHYAPGVVRVGGEEKLHPSAQALAYRRYLADTHTAFVDGKVGLSSAAYLHNLRHEEDSDFFADGYKAIIRESPIFSAEKIDALSQFVGDRIGRGVEEEFVTAVLHGEYRPSKALLANVASAIDGHRPWQLLDEQLVVFHTIMADIKRAHSSGTKKTIIITGGPGTGKSVIAAQIVGTAAGEKYAVAHATGSKAFTTNLRGIVGEKADAVFRYTHNFRDTPRSSVDLIVVDEAHRLRLKTQFGPSVYSKRPQAEEVIDAAKVSVFLLDQVQSVRLNEVGSVWGIKDYADSQGIPVEVYELDTQFRCAGSESYVNWVEYVLGLGVSNSTAWRRNGEYEVRICASPPEMEAAIRARAAEGRSARMVAGFCWAWSDPRANGSLVNDVQIGGWSMPWNRKPPEMRKVGKGAAPKPAVHPYTIWATQDEGLNEVGCIYSAQGFEFDYVGVIVGRDFFWDAQRGQWRANLSANSDTSFKSGLTRNEDLATQQLAHVYRVEATRHHFEAMMKA
jgi:hypothetical protein